MYGHFSIVVKLISLVKFNSDQTTWCIQASQYFDSYPCVPCMPSAIFVSDHRCDQSERSTKQLEYLLLFAV